MDDITSLVARRRRVMGAKLHLFYDPPLNLVRGEGVWLHDAAGRAYLDAYNNVPHVGHCHPRVAEAVAKQVAQLNTNTRYLYVEALDYAEALCATLPDGLEVCAFVNSGSEAVDLAWRMARAFTGRAGAIVMEDAYHGWTEAVDALSPISAPERPLHPHVRTLPAPATTNTGAADAARAIASLAEAGLAPAAFVVDPSFCTNGILDAPEGHLADLFAAVRGAGGLCIADEVQAGFGRLGSDFWGFASHGVVPDIVTLGKPIGNGYPLGAVLARREIMDAFMDSTSFFSTFGGNTVACAAGLAVLAVLRQERLPENAAAVGGYLKAGLLRLMEKHPVIGAVRGRGLLLGLELVRDRGAHDPAIDETRRLMNLMRDAGVLVGNEGRHGNVLKLRPPMVFAREHADRLVDALDRCLARL